MRDFAVEIVEALAHEPGDIFRELDRNSSGQVIIAGATGIVADHTRQGLRKAGRPPFAFVDNNAELWGKTVDGAPVLPPAAVADNIDAIYVSSVFTHSPLRNQLTSLGARNVVAYPTLFHAYPEAFLPFFAVDRPSLLREHLTEVLKAADIWHDQQSRDLYRELVLWFADPQPGRVEAPLPIREMYFPPVAPLRPDEIFLDCGAFDGDTVRSFVEISRGEFGRIIAMEPDPENYSRLREYGISAGLGDRFRGINAAVSSSAGEIPFVAGGKPSSHAAGAGAEGFITAGEAIAVKTVRIDDLPRPTYVKMDIEGFEMSALQGAIETLTSNGTIFAIVLYHHMSDLWQIPLFIKSMAPDLCLFLRHYAEDWSETVCYAVPRHRVAASQL